MPCRGKSLVGQQFSRWSVVEELPYNKEKKRIFYKCICQCGNTGIIDKNSLRCKNSQSCGCARTDNNKSRTREKATNWKGGRYLDDGGYIRLRLPDHPRAGRKGYVREHHIIMEQILGRLLFPDENVHHKNGVKTDNRPENLELWSTSQPCGQRTSDKVNWAQEILERYKPECLNRS